VTPGTGELVGHEWAGGSDVTDLRVMSGIISVFWKYMRLGRWQDRKMGDGRMGGLEDGRIGGWEDVEMGGK
jgi:hypothetical protein